MSDWSILEDDPDFGVLLDTYYLPTLDIASASSNAGNSVNESHPETTQVVMAPLVPFSCERAGRAYHYIVFPRHQDAMEAEDAAAAASAVSSDANDKLFAKISKVELDDYYGLLDLAEEGFGATEDEIRRNYKKISLVCHPDKAPLDKREDAEARFKAIQKGTLLGGM